MRVAMVVQSYPPVLGGAQRQVQRLGPLLERRGVAVTVVTRRPPGTPLRAREPGIDVLRLPVPGVRGADSLAYTAAGVATLARLRPDVVHVHDLMSPALIALIASPLVRAPVVAKVASTGTGGDVDRLLHKPLGARRMDAMARRFAAFVCISGAIERELSAHGVPPERLRAIPNGVDADVFRPADEDERAAARAALGLPADLPLALYCGRFAAVKRLDVLIEALRDVPMRLLLVGEGEERERLERLAADPALGGRVTLRTVVDEPAPLYRAADLYVSASSTEGMSGSVLEAMASGLPVVAAPASGMPELLGGGAGVALEDDGPAAFATALGELAQAPERGAAIGAAARARAVADYSLAATADRLAALYAELAGR
ncbi:MAG: glycosyltransferase family 4 protein [Actinobacteria bacterium]|nr:glycosyltransferase family 4 protein [Actinomycetota bacterium]